MQAPALSDVAALAARAAAACHGEAQAAVLWELGRDDPRVLVTAVCEGRCGNAEPSRSDDASLARAARAAATRARHAAGVAVGGAARTGRSCPGSRRLRPRGGERARR